MTDAIHYDGSKCPEDCLCVNRKLERLLQGLQAKNADTPVPSVRIGPETLGTLRELGWTPNHEVREEIEALRARVRLLEAKPASQDECLHAHQCRFCRARYTQSEQQQLYIKQLEDALRACDFWLDEHSCGACSSPPTASVLQVPVAVNAAMSAYIGALAHAKAKVKP